MERIIREGDTIKVRIGGKDEWKTARKVDRRLEAKNAPKNAPAKDN